MRFFYLFNLSYILATSFYFMKLERPANFFLSKFLSLLLLRTKPVQRNCLYFSKSLKHSAWSRINEAKLNSRNAFIIDKLGSRPTLGVESALSSNVENITYPPPPKSRMYISREHIMDFNKTIRVFIAFSKSFNVMFKTRFW